MEEYKIQEDQLPGIVAFISMKLILASMLRKKNDNEIESLVEDLKKFLKEHCTKEALLKSI